jgi:hypothetical protein
MGMHTLKPKVLGSLKAQWIVTFNLSMTSTLVNPITLNQVGNILIYLQVYNYYLIRRSTEREKARCRTLVVMTINNILL